MASGLHGQPGPLQAGLFMPGAGKKRHCIFHYGGANIKVIVSGLGNLAALKGLVIIIKENFVFKQVVKTNPST